VALADTYSEWLRAQARATHHAGSVPSYVAGHALQALLGRRKKFLTARAAHQQFRDLFQADMLEIDQRPKITSLTLVFTDLKASTEFADELTVYEIP
jgi:hypothetical protein